MVDGERSAAAATDHPHPARTGDPLGFFGELRCAFDRAASTVGLVEQHYVIARRHVVVRYAGRAPADPFGRALAHLRADSGWRRPAELVVHVFDSASTGVDPPDSPWRPEDVRERGLVERFTDERFVTIYQVASAQLSVLDRSDGQAVCWVRAADRLPAAERAAPLWRLLHAWLADDGLALVHGAAVGGPDGGVLLVGAGGAGKSNSTLACLPSPLAIAGDDYVGLELGARPYVHSVYSTAKIRPSDLGRLGFLAPMVEVGMRVNAEKVMVFLQEHAPGSLSAGFPLRALLCPRVTSGTGTSLVPATGAAALRALAPSSVLLAPSTAARVLPLLGALTRSLPVFELRVGSDPAAVPAAIADLLAELPVERLVGWGAT